MKIIFFQAHPDDLEFYCTHLLQYLIENKRYEVKIASLTRGEYGYAEKNAYFKGKRLGELRTKELIKVETFRGMKASDIHFFNIIDGCVQFDIKTVQLMADYLNKERPDIIFACEPVNTYYRHPDHMRAGMNVYHALDKGHVKYGKPKLYFYSMIGGDFFWPFTKKEIPFANKLMYMHASQVHIWKNVGKLYKILAKAYGRNVDGWKYAEGYRRAYYGDKKHKNTKLKLSGRMFLLLNYKFWPEKVTRH